MQNCSDIQRILFDLSHCTGYNLDTFYCLLQSEGAAHLLDWAAVTENLAQCSEWQESKVRAQANVTLLHTLSALSVPWDSDGVLLHRHGSSSLSSHVLTDTTQKYGGMEGEGQLLMG